MLHRQTTNADKTEMCLSYLNTTSVTSAVRHARVTTRPTHWAILQKERSTGIVLPTLPAPGETRLKHHRQTSLCENIYIILH